MVQLAHHSHFTAGDLEKFMGLSVGFDSMFNRLMSFPTSQQESFPPYNIRKVDEYNYVIEVALAGFSEDDIEVEVADGILTVRSTEDKTSDDNKYVHRGIARRAFSRKWTLSDDMVVRGAEFQNGLLNISLEKVIPEEKKPRLIPIKNQSKVIDHKDK